MAALTKWFEPSVKPVRPGWYETSGYANHSRPEMAHWNGCNWFWYEQRYQCLFQERHWRGLKAPAK